MTWPVILGLGAASYALKALGPLLLGARRLEEPLKALLELAAVPLLAALIVTQTVGAGDTLVVDARLPALGVAALLVWRRTPFLVVVVAAAATAALVRALS